MVRTSSPRRFRRGPAIAFAAALVLTVASAAAQRTAVPLNDYTRLGQLFSVARPLKLVWVIVPSWSDDEGGLTLTLWDSPARNRRLATKTFSAIRDNERIELRCPRPLPPGRYYWEVSDRTGTTRVGLYADPAPGGTDECAYLDGAPDRTRVFHFGVETGEMLRRDTATLVRIMRSDASATEKGDACRMLAISGGREAVRALVDLLSDPNLAHMARHALEPMPYPAVDAALRQAMTRLKGALLVGVINSIGVRRDRDAVVPLATCLNSTDAEVAEAAAAALGRIGTPASADVLQHALTRSEGRLRAAVIEACLECGRRLTASGARQTAVRLYDAIVAMEAPDHYRSAATLGRIVARGASAVDDVVSLLRSRKEADVRVALYAIVRGVPGTAATQKLAAELARLPAERAVLLAEALGQRGDRRAVRALYEAARSGAPSVRGAAARALARLGGTDAIAALVALVGGSDAESSHAASDALASVSLMEAEAAASTLLGSSDDGARRAGLEVIRTRGMVRLKPRVLEVAQRSRGALRVAALRSLPAIADARDLAALLAIVPEVSDDEAEALEAALSAAASRSAGNTDTPELLCRAVEVAPDSRKAMLARVLGVLGGSRALERVRSLLASETQTVRAAALDVLAAWSTPDAVPVLLEVIRKPARGQDALLALRGVLRIAGNPDLPAADRLNVCRQVSPVIQRDDEKRLLLGVLGNIAERDALLMAATFLNEQSVRPEAMLAVVAVAEKLPSEARGDARVRDALRRVVEADPSGDLAARARTLLSG